MKSERKISKIRKALCIAVIATFMMTAFVSVFAVASDDSEASSIVTVTKDAADRTLEPSYDCSRIITVGPGSYRWVAYFGESSKVNCIDYGDINSTSFNGKGYRSLLDFVNSDALIAKYGSTSSNPPLESDVYEFGISIHSHNDFTTRDVEELARWSDANIPTLMIVTKSLYSAFTPELIKGIEGFGAKIVVIGDCVNFFDGRMGLHVDFVQNLGILGTVFKKIDRANELQTSVEGFVKDIRSMTEGKYCKYKSAYIGSASNAGAKSLTWTVGSYVPFQLAGIKNAYGGNNTTSEDAGTEVMSKTTPSIIFMDLSSTNKFTGADVASNSVLKYAELNSVPIYTILPYFWFGYNFDNAITNAYYFVHVCYKDVISFEDVKEKIGEVYSAFFPELNSMKKTVGGVEYTAGDIVMPNMMTNYYALKGCKLIIDGVCQKVNVDMDNNKATFTGTDTPPGDYSEPEKKNDDNSAVILNVIVIVTVLIGVIGFIVYKRK